MSIVSKFSPAFCIRKSFWNLFVATATKLGMSRTCDEMIVHHTDCLHERVADCRANKLESAPREVAAHGVGFNCARGHLSHPPPTILLGLAADKIPKVSIEAPEFFPDCEKRFRVLDGRGNF